MASGKSDRQAVRMRRLTLRWAQAWCRSRHREWLRRCFRHWCEAERSASDVSPIPVEEAVRLGGHEKTTDDPVVGGRLPRMV